MNPNRSARLDSRSGSPPEIPESRPRPLSSTPLPPPPPPPALPPLSTSSGATRVKGDAAAAMKSPSGVSDPAAFQPTTKLHANDSVWSRLFRHFTVQSPLIHRFLPKLKSGRLMLEVADRSEWKQFEVVLAGSSVGDLGLYYYANKTDQAPVGCIYLHSAHIDVLEEVVMVVTQDKTWFLCAQHAREASEWAELICASIEKVSQGVLLQGAASRNKRRRLSSNASAVTLRELQSREPRARVDEFLEIFVRSNREDIRIQAMEGALSWSCMRNVAWKLWLDCLPLDMPFNQWIPMTRAKRQSYEALRAKHSVLRSHLVGKQREQDFIAACEGSDDNLLYGIFKDIRRTRGSMEFFRDPALQCLLVRILYTYSNAHPEISYNQGMGELLATIVYLLHIEQWPMNRVLGKSASGVGLASKAGIATPSITPSSSVERLSDADSDDASYVYVESFIDIQDDTSYMDRDAFLRSLPFAGGAGKYLDCCREAAEEIIQDMTSVKYLEHDAYLLLEELMFRMAGAYCPEVPPSTTNALKKKNSFSCQGSAMAMFANEMASSPLYEQMNRIHHQILSRCDPPTARHLSALGVEPQMFVLRWVRVLMSREFEMAQVWQIWDAIFSLTPSDFSFINLLCVAAVREYRDEILQAEDPTAVLLCLREISEKVEADRLVDNAKELYDALILAAAVEATGGDAS